MADSKSKRGKKIDFEASLEHLEDLVNALEEGDLSLEEALKTFEQGVKLTRECQQALEQAEQKVALLTEEDGDLASEPFDLPQSL